MRNLTALLFYLCCALPAQAEILIGVAGPFSGQNASYGNELRVGAAAAVAAVNKAGGINGETLAIVEGDDACDARRAIEVSKSFVSRDVRMVVGHFCTSASMAAIPAYGASGALVFNPSVTSPDLTSKNLRNVFRLTGRDDAQGEIAAARIKSEGQGGDVFVITDGQAETTLIAKRFSQAMPNAKIITVKAGNAKLPDEAGLIVASAVYFALQAADAADVAKAIRRLNGAVPFYGPDLLQSETYVTRGASAAEGTKVSFLQDNVGIAAASRLAELTQVEGATLAAYAAVEVFVAAAEARSVNDSKAMMAWLSSGNEIATIIGPVRFTSTGDLQSQPYVWYQWTDGTLVPERP